MELAGRPMLTYALSALRRCPEVEEVILALRPQDVEAGRRLLGESGKTERVVAGGETRQQSVLNALDQCTPGTEWVVIHDAARPLVTPELISRSLEAARETGAAVCALPCPDTVKQAGDGDRVVCTLDRSRLWLAQTPQTFRCSLLREAYRRAEAEGYQATDDAGLVERMGHSVRLFPGSPVNLKVTTPEDLRMAESLLGRASRVGFGYDAHRLGEGRPLILGGVEFDYPRGLLGHSDADVLTHAVCDALLGAAGAPDIGQLFPDHDPRYAGISSLELLKEVSAILKSSGWRPVSLDAVVVAERPKIAPRIPEIRAGLAAVLEMDQAAVGVKGTTTEGMGFTGRGEGIASYATCLLGKYEV